MVNQSTGANSVDAQDVPSAWGARTVLFLLTLIAMVQFFDRALMVVILEPLKQEFSLTDAQLGFYLVSVMRQHLLWPESHLGGWLTAEIGEIYWQPCWPFGVP